MFTWICPKCGTEVPPAYDECPRCHPPQAGAGVTAPSAPTPPAQEPQQPQAPGGFGSTLYVPGQAARQPSPAPPVEPMRAAEAAMAPAPEAWQAAGKRRSTGLRDLAITLGVAAVLLAVGFFVWTRMEKGTEPEAGAVALEDARKKPAKAHPLTRQIEMAGFRIREPKEGQLEMTAVVINHSPAAIADLRMEVELMAKGTNKLVAAFPLTIKKVGPYESVETKATVKTTMRAYELPDWQFLEARLVVQEPAP